MKWTKEKILDLDTAVNVRETWKANKEQVVFTNGCFDIVHLGHVDYLERAAVLGQRLIVGLNTDASVKRLKGDERPINNEYARARILSALTFVDAVILFSDDTPLELIRQILPDVLVKGADYKPEDIVGGKEVIEAGGRVETLNFVDGYSTTNIIKKIGE